ncbi:hypothetical protein [Candidatus Cardinium hertigii]|jgi:hypothetical protein|uniref:Outer membrane protein beta-barrel domain-containing protein n=1 Tax=Candidatus Cardinium hertigii TaxID=247481 RepID=A0A3N2QBE8_9BACT|nr:hypothetical protein [Candidatus Cardinium hertigii]ROT47125.1 hypothetical protein EDM02_04550 [Candidatus Cardinium hertigii]
MKRISVRKGILFCLSFLLTHPSKAIGFAAGPSLGAAGYYVNDPEKYSVALHNFAVQIGLFAKLDLWLLYAKLDPLFVLDWNNISPSHTVYCSKYISAPMTVGVSLFDLLRPHAGLVFLIDLTENKFKIIKNARKEEKNNWFYLLGIGVDLGNFLIDLDWEYGVSSNQQISKGSYRPKQFALRVGYNLLGLLG